MSVIPREEFTFTFEGPAVERHELEVSLLAESLIALRSLAERSCKMLYGNSDDLVVKVKGGFRSGSFSVDLILDWIDKHPEAAAIGATSIFGAIGGLIKLYKWSKGKKIECEPQGDNNVKVTNNFGQINYYNLTVTDLYNTSGAKNDAEKLTRPLEQAGVDSIILSAEDENDNVKIDRSEREFFGRKEAGILREDECIITLEIVTANLRGGQQGWRFFDGDSEFTATIEDETFLESVSSGQQLFKTGDMIEVIMYMIQRRPARRLKIDRSIIKVLTFIPAAEIGLDTTRK